jgi:DMSO reductase anchor subunit
VVERIPIITTVIAVIFLYQIGNHYKQKPKATYLLWWTIGVLTYGLGTLTESINAVVGWSVINTKLWYIAGALLGGFPLAQGTVYLFMKKKKADYLTYFWLVVIAIASIAIIMSPIVLPEEFDSRLSGSVFEWQWVRAFSPFINIYAFIFLVGGAVLSAWKYYKEGKKNTRFLGNIFIAIGGLLPGIGGSFTRFGFVEVLYVTELIGLLFIYWGYHTMRTDAEISIHNLQRKLSRVSS